MNVKDRLALLFDGGHYTRLELHEAVVDPLKFRDSKKYADRLREAQSKTGERDALIVAHGTIGSVPAVVAAFNYAFMAGSMATAVGDGIVAAAELAVHREAGLILVTASGGARMQEGILSLMQMARTTVAVDKVKEKGLPFIVVFTDPTTGGVSASFAMLGDFHIAEPGAMIGFAGPRVIENTMREKLPEGFQLAEFLLEHGMIDMVVHRHKLAETIARLLGLLHRRGAPAGATSLAVDMASGVQA
jgi:acetyl-CoA carboxylase carboxyl transferase subunit beta